MKGELEVELKLWSLQVRIDNKLISHLQTVVFRIYRVDKGGSIVSTRSSSFAIACNLDILGLEERMLLN